MFSLVIAAVAGAVVGGTIKGVVASETNKKKVQAYKDAANKVRKAADEYSGKKGLEKMIAEGIDYSSDLGMATANEMTAQQFIPTNPGSTGSGVASNAWENAQNAAQASNASAEAGFTQGMSNQATLNAANYNKETAEAQNLMKQADIDYNVANQTAQAGLDAISGGLSTVNQIGNPFSGTTNGKRGKPVVTGNPYMT